MARLKTLPKLPWPPLEVQGGGQSDGNNTGYCCACTPATPGEDFKILHFATALFVTLKTLNADNDYLAIIQNGGEFRQASKKATQNENVRRSPQHGTPKTKTNPIPSHPTTPRPYATRYRPAGRPRSELEADRDAPAPPRARVSHDHDRRRRGTVRPAPALADVGALGLLAHGCQPQLPHGGAQPLVVLALGGDGFEPAGFAVDYLEGGAGGGG